MPYRVCRKCGRQGRLLKGAIHSSFVEYYRCDFCGHVWSRDKDHPETPPRDVTIESPKNQL